MSNETNVRYYLNSLKPAMLICYYTKVKNKVLEPNSNIDPFMDTLREFHNQEKVIRRMNKLNLTEASYRWMALKQNLIDAITEN